MMFIRVHFANVTEEKTIWAKTKHFEATYSFLKVSSEGGVYTILLTVGHMAFTLLI